MMADYVFGIDGTLADNSARLRHIQPQTADVAGFFAPKDWDAFFDPVAVAEDMPIALSWWVLSSLVASNHRVLFIAYRPERLRDVTARWLYCSGAGFGASHYLTRSPALYMRADGDRRPSSEVKRDLLADARSDGYKPVMAFDDRRSDADMYRSEGVMCALLSEGNF